MSLQQHEDVTAYVLENLTITDLASVLRTSRLVRTVAKGVIRRRYRRIVEPFTGTAFHSFFAALQDNNCIITGSAARAMLSGDVDVEMRDLNVVLPLTTFDTFQDFVLNTLGYVLTSNTAHPAMNSIIRRFGKYACNGRVMTVASAGSMMSVLHIILNAPSTADMIFMTTGGLTWFYPKWLDQRLALLTHSGQFVPWEHKLGSAGELHEGLRVENGTDFVGTSCRDRCPTLWHHVEDKRLRRSVDWDIQHSVTNTFHNVDVEWRINAECTNNKCPLRIEVMSRNYEGEGAFNRSDVRFLPGEIRWRKPVREKAHILQVQNLTEVSTEISTRYHRDGVNMPPSLDDLYVNYWVRQHRLHDCTASRRRLRRSFNKMPNENALIDGTITIYLEKADNTSTTNRVLKRLARMSGIRRSFVGSVLVVKQAGSDVRGFVDLRGEDMLFVNHLLCTFMFHQQR